MRGFLAYATRSGVSPSDLIMSKLADLSLLREEIMQLARGFPVGKRVQDVHVEANDDGVGGEFLRVQFEMTDLDSIEPEDVEPLMRSIEDAVAEKDERSPSVFFAEAA